MRDLLPQVLLSPSLNKKRRISVSSGKNKGRKLQQTMRDLLRAIGSSYGLVDGDIESRAISQNGTDVVLSPAANSVFGRLAIECKNCESLNVISTFHGHAAKYSGHIPLLVHKKNHTQPLVTLRLEDFMLYFKEALENASPQA